MIYIAYIIYIILLEYISILLVLSSKLWVISLVAFSQDVFIIVVKPSGYLLIRECNCGERRAAHNNFFAEI